MGAKSPDRYVVRYAIYGAVFGLAFPVASTAMHAFVEHGGASWSLLVRVQVETPLLWVINTAPVVLAIFASAAGRRRDALVATFAELQETNNQLKRKNADLIQASQLKSQFLANMSHELRTPLNAIIGFSRIVLRKTKEAIPERQQRNLEMIHESGQHLLDLVNDLLDIERIEAGMLAIKAADVDVELLAEDIVNKLRPTAMEKGLSVTAAIDSSLHLMTDHVRLRQILDNLVGNAIKYSSTGEVTLCVTKHSVAGETEVHFAVTDQGQGIPVDQIESIFEAFHQVDGSATRAQGGVGLGLHLVRKLATLLGATIGVESTLGSGSTFTLKVPADNFTRPVTASETSAAPEPRGVGPLVLVIEDQLKAADMLQSELVDVGFRVHTALSGKAGLELANDLRPDVILLDIVMPEMDGWSVLKALRSSPDLSHIPVIVTSMLNESRLAWDLGVIAWLTKPVEPHNFRELFDRLGIKQNEDVLVVEDDAPTRSMLRQGLGDLGVSVRSAVDGRAAVQAIDDRLPNAIVLDLMLPHVDGFGVLAHLRSTAAGKKIPVIVYTAKDLSETDAMRLNGGVIEVVRKAGNKELQSVLESVHRALRNRAQRIEVS